MTGLVAGLGGWWAGGLVGRRVVAGRWVWVGGCGLVGVGWRVGCQVNCWVGWLVCGRVWVGVGGCGCLWVLVGACGGFWGSVGACGWLGWRSTC